MYLFIHVYYNIHVPVGACTRMYMYMCVCSCVQLTILYSHTDQTELPSASIDPVGSEIIVFDVDADNNSNTLELICTGDGDLRWYRGDFEPLPDSTVTPINNNTLRLRISPIINNTDATHDGIPYFCVANNSLGSARSRTKLVKFACKYKYYYDDIYIHMYMYICTCIHVHVCMYVHVHVYVHV